MICSTILTIDVSDEEGFDIITYQSIVTPRIGEEINLLCLDGKTMQATVSQVIHMVNGTDTGNECNKILVSVKNIEFL